jgi:hypothetical protein
LNEREKQEGDPECAQTGQKGMVLEEKEVWLLSNLGVSSIYKSEKRMLTIILATPLSSKVVYEYIKLLRADVQPRCSRKKKKKSPNETLTVIWQTRRKPIVYEYMSHHR